MCHTVPNLITSKFDFEFQQLVMSLKYVIILIMWIRDMRCHRKP
jgi:hypothetical protein